MRFNKLDLNLLVALNVLLAERNITRAAARLNLTQSATSNALSRLRLYFNDELLVLTGRQMVLTPRAEKLVEPVREVLMRIDSTIAAQPEFDPATEERTFTLLVSDYTMMVFIPALVARLHREAPRIHLDLRAQPERPAELLDRGEADLLIIPSRYVAPDHPSATLFEDEYVCVTWAEHPTIRERLTFDDYLSAGHVVAQYTNPARMPGFDGWFLDTYGIQRRVELSAPNLAALPYLVVNTDRIATIHRRLAERAQTHLPIRLWPAPLEIPTLVQSLQWHRYRDTDPALAWLCRIAIEIGQSVY